MSRLEEVLDPAVVGELNGITALGLDIGSRSGKAALLHDGFLHTAIVPTGVYAQETADRLLKKVFKDSGLSLEDVKYIVGTGYGRIVLGFEGKPLKVVTEISCHAMGAHFLNKGVRTIVDIGGQDSKAIRVDSRNGRVVEFIMNDKCAAGTGIFLEKVATLLNCSLETFSSEALDATEPSDISSQCVVFAESEVISLKAKGAKRSDIAAGIHVATIRRIKNLINRIGLEPNLLFTGGVSNNAGMRKALEEILGIPLTAVKLDATYAGALGAAILAQKAYYDDPEPVALKNNQYVT